MKKNIVFLYQSLAGYVYSSMTNFAELFPDCTIHIICYPESRNAPFNFDKVDNVKIYNRHQYNYTTLLELCKKLDPSVVLVSGFIDKTYLKVAYKLRLKVKRNVFLLDNYWIGSFRQFIGLLYYKFIIKKIFSHIWVPGTRQYAYANLIGFKHNEIITGFYAANTKPFSDSYSELNNLERNAYPKTLLFVGRLVEYKWVNQLVDIFIELKNENLTRGWDLMIIGEGPIKNQLQQYDGIKYYKFSQPEELPEITKNCGAFCLPSDHENYGVVIHEFAAKGLPIVCSDSIGAYNDFVINNYNGLIFKTGCEEDLKTKLKILFSLNDELLIKMGKRSSQIAEKFTKEQWAYHLYNLTL